MSGGHAHAPDPKLKPGPGPRSEQRAESSELRARTRYKCSLVYLAGCIQNAHKLSCCLPHEACHGHVPEHIYIDFRARAWHWHWPWNWDSDWHWDWQCNWDWDWNWLWQWQWQWDRQFVVMYFGFSILVRPRLISSYYFSLVIVVVVAAFAVAVAQCWWVHNKLSRNCISEINSFACVNRLLHWATHTATLPVSLPLSLSLSPSLSLPLFSCCCPRVTKGSLLALIVINGHAVVMLPLMHLEQMPINAFLIAVHCTPYKHYLCHFSHRFYNNLNVINRKTCQYGIFTSFKLI